MLEVSVAVLEAPRAHITPGRNIDGGPLSGTAIHALTNWNGLMLECLND